MQAHEKEPTVTVETYSYTCLHIIVTALRYARSIENYSQKPQSAQPQLENSRKQINTLK